MKVYLEETAKMPTRANAKDAGLDLYYNGPDMVFRAGQRHEFSTGVYMVINDEEAGFIWPRSGLASKKGVDVLGGVIDSTYRGEIKVILLNTSNEDFSVQSGSKISQIVIQKVNLDTPEQISYEELLKLSSTRGTNGFGSSGT